MGTVYRAERADGQFEKEVAVKLMTGSAVDAKSVKRFITERQILANLDHPHIARLLDGGVTENGRPYIVMEHVDGVPINRYCQERNLGVNETVRLFEKVCESVEYAHRHAVVHRDLKPGNLLVTPDGTPKLLDFGISQLVDVEESTITLERSRALTPDYASPEQLLGQAATPASDVYSLGLLLYELLCGERPARDPIVSPRRRDRRIDRDLDAIVMRALAHDPAARYGSAGELREDLLRLLESMPVTARPRAIVPRVVKFIRRNRWQAITATVLVAATVTVALLVRDSRRKAAERKRQTIAAVVALFNESDSRAAKVPQSADVRRMTFEAMHRRLEALEQDAEDDPDVLYQLALGYDRLGAVETGIYGAVGDFGVALNTFQKALALARRAGQLSEGLREKQLQISILHYLVLDGLWTDQRPVAAAAVADAMRLLDSSEAQFRRAGREEVIKRYRIIFSIRQGHILQTEDRLEEALGLWLAAVRALPSSEVMHDPSPAYQRIYAAAEANFRLAEQYCWTGEPAVGAHYAAEATVLGARIRELTHDPHFEWQSRALGGVCEVKEKKPERGLQTLTAVKRSYEEEVRNQPHDNTLLSALSFCDRSIGDAWVELGELGKAEKVYRETLRLLQGAREFAQSPAAENRRAQVSAGMGRIELMRAHMSRMGSAEAARHRKSACEHYERTGAIFRKRQAGVMYIEDRVLMGEVEKALAECAVR
jgi:tetratricopeptide (TPR) repeat protein